MPRDLLPNRSPPLLTASPEIQTPDHGDTFDDMDTGNNTGLDFQMYSTEGQDKDYEISNMLRRADETDYLHPFVSTLTIGDLDACIALENAALPQHQRCSREKLVYRLTACPSLSLGLFSSTTREPDDETRGAHEAARAPDSTNPSHKALLLGHVIATLTTMDAVTDESMDFPKTFPLHPEYKATEAASAAFNSAEADAPAVPSISGLPSVDQAASAPGHHPLGRTVAIHSVCVLPPYQHLGLGKILLRSYLQRMEGSGIADRAALLAHDELTEWYVSSLGFAQKGRSAATHGGGNLNDLRYEFSDTGLWS